MEGKKDFKIFFVCAAVEDSFMYVSFVSDLCGM